MSAPSFDDQAADWLEFAEARQRVLSHASPLPIVDSALGASVGHILGERVTAAFPMPPWDNSAMDGYALRAADLHGDPPLRVFRIVGEARAGTPWMGALESGQALRIMTGAPLPSGADTVVRFEDTVVEDDQVEVRVAPVGGRNVRRGGEDFRAGQVIAEPGQWISPALIGLLAAAGRASVRVHRRPRVAVLTSGDELLPLGAVERVAEGTGIIDSNTLMLTTQAGQAGADVRSAGGIPDRMEDVEAAILTAHAHADLVVTAGGASVGAHDLFRHALARLGYERDFWRIKLRPGSPVSMGTLAREGRTVPVLGLPGNPSSAFVTFHLFARPFLQVLAGRPLPAFVTHPVRVAERIRGAATLTMFARVVLERSPQGEWQIRGAGSQGSGLLTPLATANALAVVPADVAALEVGSLADVHLLPGAWGSHPFFA